MIQLKKSELLPVLSTISIYSSPTKENPRQELIAGLLKENLTLGTKRRLQKIHKAVKAEYEQFIKDIVEVRTSCQKEESTPEAPVYDNEKLEKELNDLVNEKVDFPLDKISMALIENISTSHNYDFEIIEKIAE